MSSAKLRGPGRAIHRLIIATTVLAMPLAIATAAPTPAPSTVGGTAKSGATASVSLGASPSASISPSTSASSKPKSCDPADVADCTKRCEGGESESCFSAGAAYYDGKGVAKDAPRGVKLFTKGCDGNNIASCVTLARMKNVGTVWVPKDQTGAASLYRKACDAGNKVGCGGLAVAYDEGAGVEQDRVKAAALAKAACEGSPFSLVACNLLGNYYRFGHGGLTVNNDEAIRVLEKACDASGDPNDATCMNLLGAESAKAKEKQAAELGVASQKEEEALAGLKGDMIKFAHPIAESSEFARLLKADANAPSTKTSTLKNIDGKLPAMQKLYCGARKEYLKKFSIELLYKAAKRHCNTAPPELFYRNKSVPMVKACIDAFINTKC